MPATTQQSDSLVGSLCREMEGLRQSWRQLDGNLSRCREERLILRLQNEAIGLQRRQWELQLTARQLRTAPLQDPLGVAFLLELTRRPLAA